MEDNTNQNKRSRDDDDGGPHENDDGEVWLDELDERDVQKGPLKDHSAWAPKLGMPNDESRVAARRQVTLRGVRDDEGRLRRPHLVMSPKTWTTRIHNRVRDKLAHQLWEMGRTVIARHHDTESHCNKDGARCGIGTWILRECEREETMKYGGWTRRGRSATNLEGDQESRRWWYFETW